LTNCPPLITLIIPVYNGERYLAKAIHSALSQTLPPTEVLVVDDGSTDGSAAIARSFGPPVHVLTQANLGPAVARNLGAVHAAGDLLAFVDADDLWSPEKLAHQVRTVQNDSSIEAVLGVVENFISPKLGDNQRQALIRSTRQSGSHHVGALLIRREAASPPLSSRPFCSTSASMRRTTRFSAKDIARSGLS
jgi:glycosyltransferase involved in cell wall biosynthesis